MPVRMMPVTTAKVINDLKLVRLYVSCLTPLNPYLKKWQSKYYHQIKIKKKTNNNHNQVVHNITSL